MALTEHQTLNTVTPSFDVQMRYFSGPDFGQLCKDGIAATLSTWTDPATPPVDWTEITNRITYASSFTQSWQSNSITWEAQLSGFNYLESLLGLGLTVICWRRFWRPTGTVSAPAGWQAWQRWYIGEIVARGERNDYRNGQPWNRTITGANFQLGCVNAPRVTAGKIRVTDGATVTGSAPLADPVYERDQGEFVGGRVSVEVGNVVDGNRNTVYISNNLPANSPTPFPVTLENGGLRISEVFFRPPAGWSMDRAWWVEVYNQRGQNDATWPDFRVAVHSGGVYTYYTPTNPDWHAITKGKAAVFCGHRKTFDEIAGEANGAEFIADVSQFGEIHLTDDAAVFCEGHVVAWAPGGASRTYSFADPYAPGSWNGATINSSLVGVGQSLVNTDAALGDRTDWVVNNYPHPGANGAGDAPIFVQVELPENVCQTLDQIDAAATTIRLDNYRGWLIPPPRDEHYGVVNGCVFGWTDRDANGLHGVLWVNAPGAPIPAGTRCYPYVDSEAQTGYPITTSHLIRRKTPVISDYRLYWSRYDGASIAYPDTGWQNQCYPQFHTVQGNVQNLNLTDACGDGTNGYLWVRTLLYLIDGMSDSGRAKVNEIEVDLAQLALDLTATAALDGQNSASLAAYLWGTWCGFAAGDFSDETAAGSHKMGQHALAITPVNKVLDDLAGATGCLVDCVPAGGVVWRENPWWPKNSAAPSAAWTFDGGSYRGDVTISQQPAQVDFLILNALSLEGDPHSVRVVYPTPLGTTEPPVWAMVTEVNDRVIAQDADGIVVAQVELEKLVLSNRRCDLVVKGVGEWARPGLRVGLTWDYTGSGTPQTRSWVIEQVRMMASESSGQRSYETSLQLTGFRG